MGSKNSDDSLVAKKIEPKNGLLGWRPGPGKLGQKGENTTPIMMSPTEKPKPKTKNFFLNLN